MKQIKQKTKSKKPLRSLPLFKTVIIAWLILLSIVAAATVLIVKDAGFVGQNDNGTLFKLLVKDAYMGASKSPLVSVERRQLIIPEMSLGFSINPELGDVRYSYFDDNGTLELTLTNKTAINAAVHYSTGDEHNYLSRLDCAKVVQLSNKADFNGRTPLTPINLADGRTLYIYSSPLADCGAVYGEELIQQFTSMAKTVQTAEF